MQIKSQAAASGEKQRQLTKALPTVLTCFNRRPSISTSAQRSIVTAAGILPPSGLAWAANATQAWDCLNVPYQTASRKLA